MAREKKEKRLIRPKLDEDHPKKQEKVLSEEFVAESGGSSSSSSDESSSDDADNQEQPSTAKKLTNGVRKSKEVAHKTKDSSETTPNASDTDSVSSSPSSNSDAPSKKGGASNNSANMYSKSGQDSESDSDSDLDSMSVDKLVQPAATDSATRGSRQELFGTKTYGNDFSPPSGFVPASNEERDGTVFGITESLSENALKGKQIWHITAPAGVPISKLENFTLSTIEKGNSVVTHKDGVYCFSRSPRETSREILLVPREAGYQAIDIPVASVLQLQQVMKRELNDSTTERLDESLVTAQQRYGKSSPPEQPRGLRMRFLPIGVVEKRKPTEPAASRKRAKRGENSQTELPDRTAKADETPEERAQRKAEKKARKEQRRITKEADKFSKTNKR